LRIGNSRMFAAGKDVSIARTGDAGLRAANTSWPR